MAIDFAALKSKAGPLPVWVWALIVGLILAFFMFYLHGRSKVNAVTPASTDPNATVSTDPYAAFANYSAAPTSVPSNQGPSGSYETNQSWMAKAIAYLTTKGYQALDIQNALTAYTTGGGVLDYNQTQIVNAAIGQFGTPPDQVYGNPTPTNVKPNPTVVRYIRSSNGSIAVQFSDNTKGEFNSMAAYTSFSANHPAGAPQPVSPQEYAQYATSQTNPTW